MTKKYWMGTICNCDICKKPIERSFVDGRTAMGPWAIMCQLCFDTLGMGIGTGKGQLYEHQANGKWMKTEG